MSEIISLSFLLTIINFRPALIYVCVSLKILAVGV
jgi:hypothetical protein